MACGRAGPCGPGPGAPVVQVRAPHPRGRPTCGSGVRSGCPPGPGGRAPPGAACRPGTLQAERPRSVGATCWAPALPLGGRLPGGPDRAGLGGRSERGRPGGRGERGRQCDLRRDFGSRWSLLGPVRPGGPWDQASPARELTHVHAVGLHLPLVLLVHGPHVAVKEAWGVRDLIAASTAEGDGRQWHPCRPGLAP